MKPKGPPVRLVCDGCFRPWPEGAARCPACKPWEDALVALALACSLLLPLILLLWY